MDFIWNIIFSRFGAVCGLVLFAFASGATLEHNRDTKAREAALFEAQQTALKRRELMDRLEQDRLAAQAKADAVAHQLEDQANADHSGSDSCLSVDRVRRLSIR